MTVSKLNHKRALLVLGLLALTLATWAFVIEPDRLLVTNQSCPYPTGPNHSIVCVSQHWLIYTLARRIWI